MNCITNNMACESQVVSLSKRVSIVKKIELIDLNKFFWVCCLRKLIGLKRLIGLKKSQLRG